MSWEKIGGIFFINHNFASLIRLFLVKFILMKTKVALFLAIFFLLARPGPLRATSARQLAPDPILISASVDGAPGAGWSTLPAISEDGRVVAFVSTAPDLVPRDTNNKADIFIYDRLEGATQRVSVNSQGSEANGWSYRFALSGDGRMVAFTSVANNLVSDDQNGYADIFTYDRLTGVTSLVSRGTSGAASNGWSDWPAISRDGRFISFSSSASNLVHGDTNKTIDVFVHDRLTGQTRRASVDSTGAQGVSPSGWATSISGDGRWVAYSTAASFDLDDTNDYSDVYVFNRVNFETLYLPTPWSTETGYLGSDFPQLDFDGSTLTLTARKVEVDGTYSEAAFVYQISMENGRTTPSLVKSSIVADSDLRAGLSSDGNMLVTRWASEVREGTQTSKVQVERLDSGKVEIISMEIRRDNRGTGQSDPPAISRDGDHIAYSMLTNQESDIISSQIYLNGPNPEDGFSYFLGGQVTDPSGTPLRNVSILLAGGQRTRTDPRGYFFFSDVSSGFQQIMAEKEGFLFKPETIELQLTEDRRDLLFVATSDDLLEEARADIGMPYSFHRGCESDTIGCEGDYHGFHAGYCTDLVLDAYKYGVDFNIQFALERDALAHPDHFYRWRNARNSQDMWRYFYYTGQMLSDSSPYLPGDILFFDWDNDAVMDHVSIVSATNASGQPTRMIDATGKIAYNPSGLAAELSWELTHRETVRGHARWHGSYGPTLHSTPKDLSVLHIAVDSVDIRGVVIDAGGAQLSAATSPGSLNISGRPISGGHINEMENGIVFSLLSPAQNGDLYLLELTADSPTVYYLHLQLTSGGLATQYEGSSRQVLAAGESHTFLIQLNNRGETLEFSVQQ